MAKTAIALAVICLAMSAAAQGHQNRVMSDPLVNLDTPGVLGSGRLDGTVDVRAFGSPESLVYTSLAARVGVAEGWEAELRGAFTGRKTLTLPGGGSGIRHGGDDVELLARYAFPTGDSSGRWAAAGEIGGSFPSTPAQSGSNLTLGFGAGGALQGGSAAFINPRAVFASHNTIMGFGLGGRIRLADHLALVGDYTPILAGQNTRDTTTGSTLRRDVYGVALRFSSSDDSFAVSAGYTNATGLTTGFALTPGLGGSGAFYIALSARR